MVLPWLELGAWRDDVFLQEHQQPYLPLQMHPLAETQDPQMIALIGDGLKTSVAHLIFSALRNTASHGKIVLQEVTNNREPLLLVADCELHQAAVLNKLLARPVPGIINRHTFSWYPKLKEIPCSSLAHLVYSKLILPFSTVVCIFADDFGGVDDVARILAAWTFTLRVRSNELPFSTYACILILIKWDTRLGFFDEKLELADFLKKLRRQVNFYKSPDQQLKDPALSDLEWEQLLEQRLGKVAILPLPTSCFDRSALYTVKKRILKESHTIQTYRARSQVAFLSCHFQSFFSLACDHFVNNLNEPFSFVQASRTANPVPAEFTFHISNFMALIPMKYRDPQFVVSIVASALYLDSFPCGAHYFDPHLIFRILYKKILTNCTLLSSSGLVDLIEDKFCEQVKSGVLSTSTAHKQLLKSFSSIWENTRCNSTCLSCLARDASNTISCRHRFCDPCIILHGRPEGSWRYSLFHCPLCQEPNRVQIYIKPYTAGVRALVLDGGQDGGMEILNSLEQSLDLPLEFRQYFDIVNGSGVGAMVALEIFCQDRMSVAESLKNLREAKELHGLVDFGSPYSHFSFPNTEASRTHWSRDLRNLPSIPLFSTGLHSSIVTAKHHFITRSWLKQKFGVDTELNEYPCSGSKICVTVTRAKDDMQCVFSNYLGTQNSLSHYPRDQTITKNILAWQCAQASIYKEPYGRYRPRNSKSPNELIDITLREQDDLWSRSGRSPDILIVTGNSSSVDQEIKPWTGWLVDHRIDKTLLSHSTDVLLASLFYITLIGIPLLTEGGLFCHAQIQCRLLPSSNTYQSLIRQLRERRARFYYHYQSIPCVNKQIQVEAEQGVEFSRYIELILFSLHDRIKIKIGGITTNATYISNCPYRLQQVIEDQGLNCRFGHRDHQKRFFGPSPSLRKYYNHKSNSRRD